VIVGGKHIDAWRRHVARLGLSEHVIFAGRVEDPLPFYAAADFYVHPTYYDPCSLVVLEAAACGLPLITSRYNGASEMFTDGEDMLLIDDPGDDRELAAAMRTLLDDDARQRFGATARQTIVQHSFQRNVDQILEIYREVLDRRGGMPHGYRLFAGRISAEEYARSTGFSRNRGPIPPEGGTTSTAELPDILHSGVDP
jgi:UDP-glucose:(heptosyl)LPS alpha-1,3-glucosyltransferase